MKRSILLTPPLALLMACQALFATTIDFGPSFPGAPAGSYVVLTNQLAGYGVVFSTTDPEGVFWFGGGYSWPPGQYTIGAGGPAVAGEPAMIDPVRVDFSPYVIQASIRGLDGGSDSDTLILKAFDSTATLVDSASITDYFAAPGLTASVSASEIAYITFEVSVPGDHGLFFDDLTYVVPEPATLTLVSLSAVALLRRKRRDRARAAARRKGPYL